MRASPLLSPAAAGQTKMPGEQTEPSAPRRAAPLSPLKVLNPEPARGSSGAVRSERAPLSGPYRAVPPSRARLRPPPPPPRPWRPISGRPRPGRVPPRPAARSGGAVKVLRSQRARIAAGRPAAPRRAAPAPSAAAAASAPPPPASPGALCGSCINQCGAHNAPRQVGARPAFLSAPGCGLAAAGRVRLGFQPFSPGSRSSSPVSPRALPYPYKRRSRRPRLPARKEGCPVLAAAPWDGRRARGTTGRTGVAASAPSGPVIAATAGAAFPQGPGVSRHGPAGRVCPLLCSSLPAWPRSRRLGLLPALSPPPRLGLLSATCTLSASLKHLRGGAACLGL